MFPLRIQFRDIAQSDFVYNWIWDHAQKLEQYYERIMSCHVVVSAPHRHRNKGLIFHIQVRLHMPGGDIVTSREWEEDASHEDIYVAIRDAFEKTTRQLEDFARRQRGKMKRHSDPRHVGHVRLINPEEGFGFVETPDGRDVYFHENAVPKRNLEDLHLGDKVRFSEEQGERGPQVTSLKVVGRRA
jgi:ribosomal subunit interface protein